MEVKPELGGDSTRTPANIAEPMRQRDVRPQLWTTMGNGDQMIDRQVFACHRTATEMAAAAITFPDELRINRFARDLAQARSPHERCFLADQPLRRRMLVTPARDSERCLCAMEPTVDSHPLAIHLNPEIVLFLALIDGLRPRLHPLWVLLFPHRPSLRWPVTVGSITGLPRGFGAGFTPPVVPVFAVAIVMELIKGLGLAALRAAFHRDLLSRSRGCDWAPDGDRPSRLGYGEWPLPTQPQAILA
jgi:hypothetical protein